MKFHKILIITFTRSLQCSIIRSNLTNWKSTKQGAESSNPAFTH